MYDTILKLSSYEECCDFFDDLCTGKELEALEQRYEVARMLAEGKVYMDIMKETGASSATISELMLGNKALARGLYEGGCSVASSYPGTPSTEVTEEISLFRDIYSEWAPNEKVAMEVAFGAALAGKRSMCATA